MNLVLQRNKLGKTQSQVAREIGVSLGAVSSWESGSGVPSARFIPGVAEVYGLDVDAVAEWALEVREQLRLQRAAKRDAETETAA